MIFQVTLLKSPCSQLYLWYIYHFRPKAWVTVFWDFDLSENQNISNQLWTWLEKSNFHNSRHVKSRQIQPSIWLPFSECPAHAHNPCCQPQGGGSPHRISFQPCLPSSSWLPLWERVGWEVEATIAPTSTAGGHIAGAAPFPLLPCPPWLLSPSLSLARCQWRGGEVESLVAPMDPAPQLFWLGLRGRGYPAGASAFYLPSPYCWQLWQGGLEREATLVQEAGERGKPPLCSPLLSSAGWGDQGRDQSLRSPTTCCCLAQFTGTGTTQGWEAEAFLPQFCDCLGVGPAWCLAGVGERG